MKLRYRGGFYSVNQTLYDIEIWQDEYVGSVQDIAFCSAPLDIEWPETDKLEPVQSSRATLQLYSDSDRQFVDLYTIKAGSVRLDVYRNKNLYWSGTLDPELYEEPFAYLTDYGVTLTFADMAILDRLNWSRTGFMTLREIIVEAFTQTGIKYNALQEYISTKLSQYSSDNMLDAISVNLANFFDEDGEPMTMREVLDETLRPYALRSIQKEGQIILYDLNEIYTTIKPEVVQWASDDAVLSVDKVYNNVQLTFSPYDKTVLINSEIPEDDFPVNEGMINTTVRISYEELGTSSEQPPGFTIFIDQYKGCREYTLTDSRARFFNIQPIYSGSPFRGVAWTITPVKKMGYLNDAVSCISGNVFNYVHVGAEMFRLNNRPYICYSNPGDYMLKISLDFLFDVRYNPFEEAGKFNEQGNWDKLQDWSNFAYVPVKIILRDDTGEAKYHYVNNNALNGYGYDIKGKWEPGEGKWGDAYLCYYATNNRKNTSGLGGWQTNHQITGSYLDDFPEAFIRRGTGEYIPMPPAGGQLDVRVGVGILQHDHYIIWTEEDIYSLTRWVLYKDLTVKIVDKYGKEVTSADQMHTAWINKNAAESYEIKTYVGTMKSPNPTARGLMLRTHYNKVISELYRNGITASAEKLLIGTIYSQFASRKNKLSGTSELIPAFTTLSDKYTPGKFMVTRELQDLCAATSDITMIEIEADNYEGVEFTDNGA